MQKNLFYGLFRMVRRVDSYGHPINLTYRGETTYKSYFGGVVTIITRIAILAFLISELINVMHVKNTVQVSESRRNVALDKTIYNFTEKEFDLALRLNYYGKNSEIYTN